MSSFLQSKEGSGSDLGVNLTCKQREIFVILVCVGFAANEVVANEQDD